MDLVIKKLLPELLDEFLNYFDSRAFTDHPDWSGCYCVEPHLCEAAESELSKGINSSCRNTAIEFINSGKLQGYLAYIDGVVSGWCNANDKHNYEKIAARKDLWSDDDKSIKIKSVMCFSVAPSMRNKGIATALLQRVCSDAEQEGFKLVEAYPYRGEAEAFHYFSGPPSMYEKNGFTVFRELRHEWIVRKIFDSKE